MRGTVPLGLEGLSPYSVLERAMKYRSFLYEVSDGIATVRLNDPEKLNALTFETYAELNRLTRALARDAAVQVLILTGTGRGFCSGGSVDAVIGELIKMKPGRRLQFTRMTCRVVANMRRLKKPIIAAVNGIAAGAGAMLALASDFRILSEQARLAFLFVKVGLSGADMGAVYLLPRMVGEGRATELLFLGDPVDAQEALRMGLANRVVPQARLMDEAYLLAQRLKQAPLHALGVTKELLMKESRLDLAAALDIESRAQAKCMETPDFREGHRAFMEKRAPVFNRR